MKQIILNEALQILRERKNQNEKRANINLERALKDENFSNLYQAYNHAIIEKAKCEAFGKPFSGDISKLKEQIKQRLNELKIGSIKSVPVCKKCEDLGFVEGKYCDCLKQEISKILLKNSGFENLQSFEKSNFDIFENKEEVKKIYKLMYDWCNKTDSTKNLVYLLGPTGTGKTHLLSCMANEFIKQNKIVVLATAFNLSQEFLKFHTSQNKSDILDNYLSCEVLFIDDLGTEPFLNNVTREYTYLIINERKAKGLKTVITSNLSLMDLRDRYDERIFSRIVDQKTSIVLQLNGNDKRLKK